MLDISINAVFLDDQSIPEESIFLWAYHIKIVNKYRVQVVIKKRKFVVVDSISQTQVIEGVGVANVEPIILAGDTFEYASGVLLTTPSGFFSGEYTIELENKETVVQQLPSFSLDSFYDLPKIQ